MITIQTFVDGTISEFNTEILSFHIYITILQNMKKTKLKLFIPTYVKILRLILYILSTDEKFQKM